MNELFRVPILENSPGLLIVLITANMCIFTLGNTSTSLLAAPKAVASKARHFAVVNSLEWEQVLHPGRNNPGMDNL